MQHPFGRIPSIIAGLALFAAAASAAAQSFPTRPVRIIVPLAAGGGMDSVSRGLAQKLNDTWGQTVVVDNRPGAGSLLGLDILSASAADGYTLMMISSTTVIHPLLYGSRFDIVRDFAALSQVTQQGYVVVIHPSLPAKSIPDFVRYLKDNPNKVNFASSGIGSPIHMTGELFQIATGTKMTHIPFKGLGAAYTDLIAGRIQSSFATVISSLPHIKGGRLRALAVTPPKRFSALPDIPTLKETGVDVAVVNWYGLVAPLKTPSNLITHIASDVAKAMHSPDVVTRLDAEGSEAVGSTPKEFAAHLREERDRWGKVIKIAGITAR